MGQRRRLPAGTSEYQAAWILDDDEGDDPGSDGDEAQPDGGGGQDAMEADAAGGGEPGSTDGGGTEEWQDDQGTEAGDERMEARMTPACAPHCVKRSEEAHHTHAHKVPPQV